MRTKYYHISRLFIWFTINSSLFYISGMSDLKNVAANKKKEEFTTFLDSLGYAVDLEGDARHVKNYRSIGTIKPKSYKQGSESVWYTFRSPSDEIIKDVDLSISKAYRLGIEVQFIEDHLNKIYERNNTISPSFVQSMMAKSCSE